ncbi:MAG: tRNA (adenosine(37)-N6)-dimethylallyltransferase MiaA [bacterium]
MKGNTAIVIAGPTATGKTDIAHQLALKYNGEIICADSRTIYRYMDIATSKPEKIYREQIPYHIIDIVNPDEKFSVADFVEKAEKSLEEIFNKGKIPFIVGGCGLYIKRLIDGIFPSPPSSKEIREFLKKKENLWDRLKEIDKEAAERINPNDKKRLIRALEVFYLTKKPISVLQKEKTEPSKIKFTSLCIDCDRKVLYERIDERVDKMIEKGLIDETKMLLSLGYSSELTSMSGIGYREIIHYLKGEINLDEAIFLIKRRSRQFAKRQMTWFRNDKRYIFIKKEEIKKEVAIISSFS